MTDPGVTLPGVRERPRFHRAAQVLAVTYRAERSDFGALIPERAQTSVMIITIVFEWLKK